MEKKCVRCGVLKDISFFYKHERMRDGRLNVCKECVKCRVRDRERELRLTSEEWVEKERTRGREKYHRLGYKDKKRSYEERKSSIQRYKTKYPEKQLAKQKSASLLSKDGLELHHWNYSIEFAKDVIPLSVEEHRLLHRHMVYDESLFLYRDLQCNLLDTKDSHLQLLSSIKNNM